MQVDIEPSWRKLLQEEFDSEYFGRLVAFVHEEYSHYTVFPPAGKIFSAFNHCTLEKTRVVILGQDPYHNYNQANGLCFSVNDGIEVPPSLINIYREIADDMGKPMPRTDDGKIILPSGNLERWADQGVLLLNATLTVRAHQAASHQGKGWETFTDNVIRRLSAEKEHVVFLLWGSSAIKKSALIDPVKHKILTAPHPSPLSAYRGFFGCKHFSKANEYLVQTGQKPIEW